ncbi:MAG: hypothetical protein V1802_01085, partial [Candidatus Aenigmatarchaeota archaeon]
GAYYMLAEGVSQGTTKQVTSANYTFTCPTVDLANIIVTRDRFIENQKNYKSVKDKLSTLVKDEAKRLENQPCYDAVSTILTNVSAHIDYLNSVINSPFVDSANEAKGRTSTIDSYTKGLADTYCLGAKGFLKIQSADAQQQVRKGTKAKVMVSIENIGELPYYGMVQCDFTTPIRTREKDNSTCAQLEPGTTQQFSLLHPVNMTGKWNVTCSAYASITPDCVPTLHDTAGLGAFSVYEDTCSAKITKISCSYNDRTKRYIVSLDASWAGGDHANAIIEGDTSKKFSEPFNYSTILSSGGMKNVDVQVHDEDDKIICNDKKEIYCTEGDTSGNIADVTRKLSKRVRTGNVTVEFDVMPYANMPFILVEMLEGEISDWHTTGNATKVSFNAIGSETIDGKQFNKYSWAFNLTKSRDASIVYTTTLEDGIYEFSYKAKMLDKEANDSLTVFATSCDQINTVIAVKNKECKEFTTSCNVPSGWRIVASCPKEEGGINLIWIIIVIVAVIAIILLIYYFKKRKEENKSLIGFGK